MKDLDKKLSLIQNLKKAVQECEQILKDKASDMLQKAIQKISEISYHAQNLKDSTEEYRAKDQSQQSQQNPPSAQ